MRTATMIRQHVGAALAQMHSKRALALIAAVEAILRGGRLSVCAWGRALCRPAKVKHRIKCIDRLLSNAHVQRELPLLVHAHITRVVQSVARPLIVIDWTQLTTAHWALCASMVSSGRAVPLCQAVHTAKQVNKTRVQRRFVQQLQRQLPAACRPIVITDAGFRNPWYRDVIALGWDVVGRVTRNVMLYDRVQNRWCKAQTLMNNAGTAPQCLGAMPVAKSNALTLRCVLYKSPPKGRKGAPKVNRKGTHPKSTTFAKYQRRHRDPWLLVTSLHDEDAHAIAAYYAARMQCEQTFRDIKNHRYGLCFEDVRCRTVKRLEVMLLLANLAIVISTWLGAAAERAGHHRHYQANTTANRRVLSRFVLGILVLRDSAPPPLERSLWARAFRDIITDQNHLPSPETNPC